MFRALDASGLSGAAFGEATGLSPRRLQPSYRRRMAARLGVDLGVDLVVSDCGVRFVEVVPRLNAAAAMVETVAPLRVKVATPGGWHLDVPGELLGELVRALAATSC